MHQFPDVPRKKFPPTRKKRTAKMKMMMKNEILKIMDNGDHDHQDHSNGDEVKKMTLIKIMKMMMTSSVGSISASE